MRHDTLFDFSTPKYSLLHYAHYALILHLNLCNELPDKEGEREREKRPRISMRVLKFRIIDDIRYNAITTYKSKLLYTQRWGNGSKTSRKKTHLYIHAHEMEPRKKTVYAIRGNKQLFIMINFQLSAQNWRLREVLLHFCNLLEKVKFMGDFSPWLLMLVRTFVWYSKPQSETRKNKFDIIFAIFFSSCFRYVGF